MPDQLLSFTVHTTKIAISTAAQDSSAAIKIVLDHENAPRSAFVAVYQDNPVPRLPAFYGAPMGRPSAKLDAQGAFKAEIVKLDDEGYDEGLAYWGLRKPGMHLYAVQDGLGHIAFVDAANDEDALRTAPRADAGRAG